MKILVTLETSRAFSDVAHCLDVWAYLQGFRIDVINRTDSKETVLETKTDFVSKSNMINADIA